MLWHAHRRDAGVSLQLVWDSDDMCLEDEWA